MPHRFGSTLPATTFADYISIFSRFPLRGFYARGEPREYPQPFTPSIWRPGHDFMNRTSMTAGSNFTVGEYNALLRCQEDVLAGRIDDEYFIKFISDPNSSIDVSSPELFHWLALAQHYNNGQRHPTRLIDLTRDPFVALYFAVVSEPGQNGFVYYFRNNFNEIRPDRVIVRGSTFLDVLEVSDPGDRWPAHPDENTLNVGRTPFPNRRIEAQRGAFCWTRGNEIDCYRGGALIIEIESQHKPRILDELGHLNYEDHTLFPRRT